MAVSHIKSDTIADFTGTITGFNSQGSTTTIAATDLVRPSDWNSAHNQFYTLTGNTTGNSTASGTNVIFAGSNDLFVGGSTGTIIVQNKYNSGTLPYLHFEQGTLALGNASLYFAPVQVPIGFVHSMLVYPMHYSQATNSTLTVTMSAWWGWYTQNNSTLSLHKSGSGTQTVNGSGTASSGQNSGNRFFTFGSTDTISAANYVLGVVYRSTTAGANASISQLCVSQQASTVSGIIGIASAATNQRYPGLGVYTATTAGIPNSVGYTQINGNSSAFQRPPAVFFTNQLV